MKYSAYLLPLVLLACDKPEASPTPERTSKTAAPTADAKTAAPTAETQPATTGAPAADGPFAEFAKFINEASDAIEKAARGEKVEGFNIEPGDAAGAAKLKDAKRVFASVEVEAMSDTGYVRTNVVVFPDGTVRWVELAHKPEKALVKATPDIDKASPVLATTSKQLIETLAGDNCSKLPILTPAETEKLPQEVQAQTKPTQPQLDALCTAMKGKADGWTPRYDDFTIGVKAGEALVAIKSGFEVKDGKLHLLKPRVR
ncbi:MAG TPA: hypothetical protein VFB62_16450 [Polyangiaceae bacterium]|jgi:hypothetical protein|nr:hypothetical protein [Polyangiaceae bacterium]